MTQENEDMASPAAGLFPPLGTLKRLAVSESGFIFDPASGHHFTVNDTGLELLRLLLNGQRLDQILVTLGEEYNAEPRVIERDVLEFVSALRENVGA